MFCLVVVWFSRSSAVTGQLDMLTADKWLIINICQTDSDSKQRPASRSRPGIENGFEYLSFLKLKT